jgi:hypothetical protein
MGFSIQDYLKKINSSLSFIDILSLLVLFLGIALFAGYIWHIQSQSPTEVVYRENAAALPEVVSSTVDDNRPFGSIKGKTYTFNWCQGSNRISLKNKIYFGSEEEAKGVGRTLSKMCKR